MPYTVNAAFNTYRSDSVDLDGDQVKQARRSRDYLVSQVKALARDDSTFPELYSGFWRL